MKKVEDFEQMRREDCKGFEEKPSITAETLLAIQTQRVSTRES